MSPSLLLTLSLRKLALRSSHTLGIRTRMFSSSSTSTTTTNNPYLLYRVTSCDGDKAGAMTDLHLFDPAKEEFFTVGDKPLPKELVESRLVGSSHGWGVYFTSPDSILISDFCNPKSSKSNPKIISLQTRKVRRGGQVELVSGLAMSSSCPQKKEEFLMVVKYRGRLLNVFSFTPGQEVGRLYTSDLIFDYFEHAKLMYSKRDNKFYMPSSGGHHLFSWDGLSSHVQHHELRFHGHPQFSNSELQLLASCHRTQHLVESPSGQRFLVKWYAQILADIYLRFECGGTKQFMVFREEDEMNMCYTQDIGDLCIFLGNNNEPFCVEASSFPGLKPNSIYFLGEGFGVYDIASRTPRSFNPKSASPLPPGLCYWVPHWLPPSPL